MKKFFTVLLSLTLMATLSVPAFAVTSEPSSDQDSAKVSEIMYNYNKDKTAANRALAELGYELVSETEVRTINASPTSEIAPFYISPSTYSLSVYSFRKTGQSQLSLQFMLETNQAEPSPGPLDYVSIEYNSSLASYYSSAGDGNLTTVQGRDTGLVTFNLEDRYLNSSNYTYGTVKILPKSYGSTLEYGSKFAHTYRTTSSSGGSIGGSLNLASMPSIISGGLSFQMNLVSSVECFYLWTDNAITL